MNAFIQWLIEFGQTLLIIINGVWNFFSVLPLPINLLILALALYKLVIPLVNKFRRI